MLLINIHVENNNKKEISIIDELRKYTFNEPVIALTLYCLWR